MDFLIPSQDFFENQFGFAVWVNGALRMLLIQRHVIGNAIGRTSRAEDDFFNLRCHACINEVEPCAYVVGKVLFRQGHGLAHFCQSCKVNHGLGLNRMHFIKNPVPITQAAHMAVLLEEPRPLESLQRGCQSLQPGALP